MQVILTPRAIKHIQSLQVRDATRIKTKLHVLTSNPYAGKLLHGKLQGWYSWRVWPYRIVYQIDVKEQKIWILSIVHRQGAFKP